ncbi:MAG: sigma-70 family RNA polymerase sigma factor [Planctomycetes bacterium]|nr:sigma-70 family RNA polymerase sigma factor [Planctomycetota bacterium]
MDADHPPSANRADDSVEQLLQAWAAGSESALAELVARVGPKVRRLASARLGDRLRARLDSQDIAQDTLMAFFRDAPRFVVRSEAELIGLLVQILVNNLRYQNRFHAQKQRDIARQQVMPDRSTVVFGEGLAAHSEGPSTQAGKAEEASLVRLALETLDAIDHRIVTMRVYENASFPDIAAAIGSTADAVRKRFERAMPRLAQKLCALREGRFTDFIADDDGR